MAAFDFPSSPNVNDIYTLNGVAFMWNGSVWKRYSTSTGAQGFQGAAGAAGAQGAQGTNGTIGSDGAQGAQGHQGATGSGAQGAAGAQGNNGAQGAAGAQGTPFDRSEYNYTASGGQTAFAAAYANASDVDVFMNGVRLTPAEYTPSGGTTITLASGATAGDIIDILTFASAGPTGAQGAQGHQGDAFNRSESNFTATSGQTSFAPSGGYTNGDDLDVFVNGVRLTPADYTATNGTNVVLDVGANTGDIVDIIYYEAAGPAGAQGAAGAAGIAGTITFSTSAPSNPIMGDLWYDTDDGAFAGYYNDGNTSQWIDLSGGPRGAQGADGAQGATGSIPSNITAVNGTFSGNVSIGGTLTYEDVTNIDSVGVITARSGIDVTGGSVGIGTDNPSAPLHLSGADANDAKIKIEDNNNGFAASEINVANGGRDLRIAAPQDIYFEDVDTGVKHLYIESGGNIGIGTDNPGVKLDIVDSGSPNIALRGSSYPSIRYSALDGTTDAEIYYGIGGNDLVLNNVNAGPISLKTSNTERFRIHSTGVPQFTTTGTQYVSASVPAFVVNSNGDHALVLNNQNTTDPRGLFIYQDQDVNNGTSYFLRARAGGTDRAHLYSNGTLQLHSGNLKLASGNGIDFSAAGNASGMSSELLDDYEEGTFTPTDASGAGLTLVEAAGIYTKVGRMVHVQVRVKYPSTSNTSYASIGGFPFSATNQGTNISNGANASGFGYFTGSNVPQIHMSASGTHTNFYNLSTIQRNNNFSGIELRFGIVYSTA